MDNKSQSFFTLIDQYSNILYFIFQVITLILKWDAKLTMSAFLTLLEGQCIQHHFCAPMEHFSSNKYSTVIGGMN